MFTFEMYSSMRCRMILCIESLSVEYAELSEMEPLKVLGSQTWDEIAVYFADQTSLAIWNHNKTWIVNPPNLEGAKFTNKKELLSAIHYLNWTWDLTPKMKELLSNTTKTLISIGKNMLEGVTPPRDLSHFDL